MVTRGIVLEATNCALKLEINSDNWCRVYLQLDNSDKYLGADSYNIIRERLCNAFSHQLNNDSFGFKGLDLFWVLSLAETHATINACYENNATVSLIAIEDGGHILPKLCFNTNHVNHVLMLLQQ